MCQVSCMIKIKHPTVKYNYKLITQPNMKVKLKSVLKTTHTLF